MHKVRGGEIGTRRFLSFFFLFLAYPGMYVCNHVCTHIFTLDKNDMCTYKFKMYIMFLGYVGPPNCLMYFD